MEKIFIFFVRSPASSVGSKKRGALLCLFHDSVRLSTWIVKKWQLSSLAFLFVAWLYHGLSSALILCAAVNKFLRKPGSLEVLRLNSKVISIFTAYWSMTENANHIATTYVHNERVHSFEMFYPFGKSLYRRLVNGTPLCERVTACCPEGRCVCIGGAEKMLCEFDPNPYCQV